MFTAFFRRVLAKIVNSDLQNNNTRLRHPRNVGRVSANSLLFYYGDFHSQRGQDGILAKIFRRLGFRSGYFVEFGAWDGCYLSDTRSLYERGWGGVFNEGNERRYQKLQNTYKGAREIKTICAFVGAPSFGFGTVTLAELLREHGVDPGSVSFLSIDVDGVDLEIFEDMDMTPPVVLIEGGFNFSPRVRIRVPLEIARYNMQQPLSVTVDVSKKSGYSPVCFFYKIPIWYGRTFLAKHWSNYQLTSCIQTRGFLWMTNFATN